MFKILFKKTVACMILLLLIGPGSISVEAKGKEVPTNKILYIDTEISTTDKKDGFAIVLRKSEIVDGQLKPNANTLPEAVQKQLKCTIMDANYRILETFTMRNPLIHVYDTPANNYDTLQPHNIKLRKVPLTIRANYQSAMKYLKVEALNNEGKVAQIGLLDINPTATSKAGQFEVVKILDNGPSDKRINIVIMGDGYRSSELNKFINDAMQYRDYLFSQAAYAPYKYYFNVYAVKVISNMSGAATSPSNLIDNYFGSAFNYGGIDRLLVPTKTAQVYEVLRNHVPDYDQAIVVVNSDKYGGSGGPIATTSTNTSSREILIHELGHSFAGLSDEYWAGSQYARENINMTRDNNPGTVRWKYFSGNGGVGIYPFEAPGNGWYRPHEACKMRYLGQPFCLVCLDAHWHRIRTLANGGR